MILAYLWDVLPPQAVEVLQRQAGMRPGLNRLQTRAEALLATLCSHPDQRPLVEGLLEVLVARFNNSKS